MSLKIEAKGLLFNLFIIYLLTITHNNNNYFDFNKLKLLSRVSIFLIFIYLFFDFNLLSYSNNYYIFSLFDGLCYLDNFKLTFIIFIKILAIFAIYASNFSNLKINYEVFLIFLSNLFGISFLLYSNDLIITIISWELFNFTLYLLVSINTNSEASLSASLKYFILSALSTCFFILGFSILYYFTGASNFDNLFISLSYLDSNIYINLALFFIFTTLLFKLGAFPFYNWAPDLYGNLNNNINIWMIIIPKVTIIGFFFFLYSNFSSLYSPIFIEFSAIFSLIIGSLGLINQWNIKRFIAYSGISHIGFILLALLINDFYSYIIYTFIYSITSINIFFIFIIFSNYLKSSINGINGKDISYINQLIGIFKVNPFLTFSLSISLFSLAGKFSPYPF